MIGGVAKTAGPRALGLGNPALYLTMISRPMEIVLAISHCSIAYIFFVDLLFQEYNKCTLFYYERLFGQTYFVLILFLRSSSSHVASQSDVNMSLNLLSYGGNPKNLMIINLRGTVWHYSFESIVYIQN